MCRPDGRRCGTVDAPAIVVDCARAGAKKRGEKRTAPSVGTVAKGQQTATEESRSGGRLGSRGHDWRVSHDAHGNHFQVEVNLNSKQIKLDDLDIPEAKGTVVKKE
jgi:hypothetical protein